MQMVVRSLGRWGRLGLVVALAAVLTTAPATAAPSAELLVGTLLSLSGPSAVSGLASKAALELATEDANEVFSAAGSPVRVRLVVADTKSTPVGAVEGLHALADQGVTVLVGPDYSSQAAAIRELAAARGILAISHSSSASQLAIAGDNLFRLVPEDTGQSEATARMMLQQGVKVVVPIWRDDVWGNGVASSTRQSLERLGASAVEGVTYDTGADDLSTAVSSLSQQVHAAIEAHGVEAVAVYVAGFEETVTIMSQAARFSTPGLQSVRWYGTDGFATNAAIHQDADAARFAIHTRFWAPVFGLDPRAQDTWKPLSQRIAARTGESPDVFAFVAYDALRLATLTFLTTGGNPDADALKTTLPHVADSYFGVIGRARLDAAGDRADGSFDFWGVREGGDGFEWEMVGRSQSD